MGSKSISFKKLRFRRLNTLSPCLAGSVPCGSERRLSLERARHAVRSAATAPQLEALDGDDLDPRLAQGRVGARVALVGDDHAGLEGDDVVAIVPLLAFGLEAVPARLHHAHLRHTECGG